MPSIAKGLLQQMIGLSATCCASMNDKVGTIVGISCGVT